MTVRKKHVGYIHIWRLTVSWKLIQSIKWKTIFISPRPEGKDTSSCQISQKEIKIPKKDVAKKWEMNTFTFGRIRGRGVSYQSIEKYPSVMVSEVTNMRVDSICADNFRFVMNDLRQVTRLLFEDIYCIYIWYLHSLVSVTSVFRICVKTCRPVYM